MIDGELAFELFATDAKSAGRYDDDDGEREALALHSSQRAAIVPSGSPECQSAKYTSVLRVSSFFLGDVGLNSHMTGDGVLRRHASGTSGNQSGT